MVNLKVAVDMTDSPVRCRPTQNPVELRLDAVRLPAILKDLKPWWMKERI